MQVNSEFPNAVVVSHFFFQAYHHQHIDETTFIYQTLHLSSIISVHKISIRFILSTILSKSYDQAIPTDIQLARLLATP